MCGRYGLSTFPEKLLLRLRSNVRSAAAFVPHFNIAPTQPVLAVVNDDERTAMDLRWGLIPVWAASPASVKLTTFNARIETIATAPAYREALRSTRCAILASGYYEWRKNADGTKTPLWIARRDGEPFAFAGLWSTWRRGGAEIRSCTIVTQPPNEFAAAIHSRMPVVLREADAESWLAPGERDAGDSLRLLEPQSSGEWTAYSVSARVGNVRNDDADLIAPT